jgi:hypothetical protein
MNTENTISKAKNILLVLSDNQDNKELSYLIQNFCGTVVKNLSEIHTDLSQQRIYICGDISKLEHTDIFVYVIAELSYNYENFNQNNIQFVKLGKVPIIIHNAGVFFRAFFDEDDYFHKIKSEHIFQDLTESNKPGMAFRKGIYLTEILRQNTEKDNEILHYRLLRCSSNFSGATDNFRPTDHKIINAMNEAVKYVFDKETSLNHVLAQIYENKKKSDSDPKDTKAKIKAHSDKTKDMPKDALIAFCTFYDSANFTHLKPSKTDSYDYCYKDTSGLTRLHFKLKTSVLDPTLTKEFTVVLYPNSIFFIPLSTNRLYTHEIKPSALDIDKIPTRMGYVARCSNTEAAFIDGQTYIKADNALIKLENMTDETMNSLKGSYIEENQTENRIEYGEVHFSMNLGDYQKPIY